MDEWKPRTEVVVGEIPHYTNPDQFTVKIFHGGRIKDNNYLGGSIDYYDNCDKDMMSLTEVHAMVRSLKHSGRIDYWYSIGSEDDALTKLSCDTDVTDMCSFVPDFRLIIMYLDHLDLHEHDQVDEVFIHDSFVFSQDGSSGVVIEELLEEPTMSYYIKEMILMKNMDPLAYDWLTDPRRPPKHWSRAHFNTHLKCDTLLNNLCESFNSFILPARCKHIVSMMEDIRQKLMKRIQIRRDKMSNYEGIICPKIKEILELNKVKAATDCIARGSGGPLVEIESFSGGQYVVNLERFSCTCRRWDLTGIPCKHGVSAIHFMRKKPEDFVDKCYLKSTYMEIYGNIILPVNGMDLWERYEHPPILPPRYNRQPGRPRTKRIKDASEKEDKSGHKLGRSQRSLRCGNCKEFGHNVKTCQRHLPPKSNKRKRVSKKEASTSANPTQTEATVGLERKLLMRKNFLREKSKIRAEEAKKKRNAKKASSAQGSTRNTSKASSSQASQTKATSKASTPIKASTRIRNNSKDAGK